MTVLGQNSSTLSPAQDYLQSSQQELPNDSMSKGEAAPQNASAGWGFAPQRVPESELFVLNIPA